MPRHIHKDPTEFFSVVGAPYVRESRAEPARRHHHHHHGGPDARQPEAGVAGLWLVFYVAIFGASLFANSGAARLVEVATHW